MQEHWANPKMMPPVQKTLLLLQIYYKALKNAYGADYYFEGYFSNGQKAWQVIDSRPKVALLAAEGSAARGRE